MGNLLSVQLYDKANADLGGQIAAQIAAGDFAPLLGWLRENVHQWGRKYLPERAGPARRRRPARPRARICSI